jgi:TP901 family phage tail tape measure protein
MGYEMQGFGRNTIAANAAVAASIAAMANEYVKFNEAATRAGMAMEMETGQIDALQAALLDTSESVGAFSAADLAEGVRLWAAGTGETVQSTEQLNRVLQDTVSIQQLASMNATDLGSAVNYVGGIMHEYGMNVQDVGTITATLNYVAAKTFANVDDLGEAFKMVGPIANSMGISFTETAASLALLSDQNIKGTMAGRAFRQMLIQLNKPSADYSETMNEILGLSKEAGDAWQDIIFPKGQFTGMAEYIGVLAEKLSKYTEAEKNRKLAVLATANSLPSLVALTNEQIKVQDKGINVISVFEKTMTGQIDAEVLAYKAWYEETEGLPYSTEGAIAKMTGMWETFTQSHAYRVEKMKRQWETATIRMGEAFTDDLLPTVEAVMDRITGIADFFERNPWVRSVLTSSVVGSMGVGVGALGLGYVTQVGADVAMLTTALSKGGSLAKIGIWLGSHGVTLVSSLKFLAGAGGVIALSAGIIALTKQLSSEQRAAEAKMVAEYPKEVQELMDAAFRTQAFGLPGWTPTTDKGEELYAQATGLGLPNVANALFLPPLTIDQMKKVLDALDQEINATAREIAESVARIRVAHYALGREIDVELPASSSRWSPEDIRAKYEPKAEFTDQEQGIIDAWGSYEDDVARIDEQLVENRQNIWSSYNDWYTKAQRDLGRNLAELADDARADDEERAAEHNDKLAELNEDYLRDMAKAQQEHDLSMRRMAEDHNDRLVDLLETGDVRGITKEMGQYKKDKKRAIEDFGLSQSERQTEYDKQRQDQQKAYAKENTDRKEQYEKRRQDLLDQFALDKADREADAAAQAAELEAQAVADKKRRGDTLMDELAEEKGFTSALRKEYEKRLEDAEAFWRGNSEIAVAWWKKTFDALGLTNETLDKAYEDLLASENTEQGVGAGGTKATDERLGTARKSTADFMTLIDPASIGALAGSATPERYNLGAQVVMTQPMVNVQYTANQTFSGMKAEDKAWFSREAKTQISAAMLEVADLVRKGKRGTL